MCVRLLLLVILELKKSFATFAKCDTPFIYQEEEEEEQDEFTV